MQIKIVTRSTGTRLKTNPTINMMSTNQQMVQIQSAPYQPTVYVVPTATAGNRRENFSAKTISTLGKTQIVLGTLNIFTNIFLLVYTVFTALRCLPIICGILAIIAGIFGIGASKNKTTCLIVSSMVLSILAAVVAGLVILNISLSLHQLIYYYHHIPYYEVVLTLQIVTSITALLELVCGILASTLGCKVTCCNSQPATSYQAMYEDGTAPPVVMVPAATLPAANENVPVQMTAPPACSPPITAMAPPSEFSEKF